MKVDFWQYISAIFFFSFLGYQVGAHNLKTYQLQSTNTIMVKFRASHIDADFTPACAPGWKIVRVER